MVTQEILEKIGAVASKGALGVKVTSVTEDSRQVREGMAFVAVRGVRADGHDYIEEAVKAGASLVVSERGGVRDDVPFVQVKDSRLALALLASYCAGEPSLKMVLLGVTGTDGKTSTSMLTEAGLRACGFQTGLIGTVVYRYPGVTRPAPLTTPDAPTLQETLKEMVEAGVNAAVMEVSSHALDQRRADGCHFTAAAFTCLSRDHLDYHKTVEEYANAKLRLFADLLRASKRAKGAIVNLDDPFSATIKAHCPVVVLGFSLRERGGDIYPVRASFSLDRTDATVSTPFGTFDLSTDLIGAHNLANIEAALGFACILGLDLDKFLEGVSKLKVIPGRLQRVHGDRPVYVFVDYAHTPKAIENVLRVLRDLAPGSRLTIVFGAGGDRDKGKRPLMGRGAARLADRVVVTSDNPRTEDPKAIIRDILVGIEEARAKGEARAEVTVIEDRREAIKYAITSAEKGEVVLIAGKGHEDYQILGTEKRHFSDVECAQEFLS